MIKKLFEFIQWIQCFSFNPLSTKCLIWFAEIGFLRFDGKCFNGNAILNSEVCFIALGENCN